MLEVSKKFKGKTCDDFNCSKCPIRYFDCDVIFKVRYIPFEDIEFEDSVPEKMKNYVKEVLKEE